MASYFWRNANNDQNGETPGNWDDPSGDPHIVAPGVNDALNYDGNEDNAGLPTSLAADVRDIYVSNAYAGITDFTDFAPSARQWSTFGIEGPLTLAMSGFPAIVSGGTLIGIFDAILDVENPIDTEGPCTINWQLDGLDIYGGINASHAITHIDGEESTLKCDVTGDLDIKSLDESGDPVNSGIAIEISADVSAVAAIYAGSFLRSAGKYNDGGFDHKINGDILKTGGTLVSSGEWTQTASGDVANDGGGFFAKFINPVGVVTNLTDDLDCYAIKTGGTINMAGAFRIVMILYVDNFWEQNQDTSSVNARVVFAGGGTYTNVDGVTITSGDIAIETSSSLGDISFGGCFAIKNGNAVIAGTGPDDVYVLRVGETFEVSGELKLGSRYGATGSGQLFLSDNVATFGSIKAGGDTNADNQIHLSSAHVECSGSMDADHITIFSNEAFPPEIVFGPGGTILNTADKGVDFAVGVHGDVNVLGANNDANITAYTNNQAAPGSLMTMGIGGGRLIVP